MQIQTSGILALKARGIEIPRRHSIKDQLQRLTFQDPDVKYLTQQALVSHVRSVHPHHDKAVFKVEALPVEAFAASLGLAGAPKIRLLSRTQAICTTCPAIQSEMREIYPVAVVPTITTNAEVMSKTWAPHKKNRTRKGDKGVSLQSFTPHA